MILIVISDVKRCIAATQQEKPPWGVRVRNNTLREEEIGEAPPVAEEASQFRGSGTIGTPNGRGNRNAATVTAAKNGSRLFAACGRLGQLLAALPLYGCRIPLAGKSLRRCFAPQGRGVRGAGLVDLCTE